MVAMNVNPVILVAHKFVDFGGHQFTTHHSTLYTQFAIKEHRILKQIALTGEGCTSNSTISVCRDYLNESWPCDQFECFRSPENVVNRL